MGPVNCAFFDLTLTSHRYVVNVNVKSSVNRLVYSPFSQAFASLTSRGSVYGNRCFYLICGRFQIILLSSLRCLTENCVVDNCVTLA